MSKESDFLPPDYEQPQLGGAYLKFQDGDNKFRILSKPIIGWQDWKEKKPIRSQFNDKPEKAIDPEKPIKHFWSMIVWSYTTKQIEILEITQGTIQKAIKALIDNQEWGRPYTYDITVNKKGQKLDTEYTVIPSPHKEITKDMKDAFAAKPIDLNKLFKSEDPFSDITARTPIEDMPF